LDNLLASLSEEAAPVEEPAPTDSKSAEAEPEIDPDLAKLLKELGS
jgi:hypothetical protein